MSYGPELEKVSEDDMRLKYWHIEYCNRPCYEFGFDVSFDYGEIGIYFARWYVSFNWRGKQ